MPPMPGQPGVYKSPRSAALSTAALFQHVPDVNATFDRALKGGCTGGGLERYVRADRVG